VSLSLVVGLAATRKKPAIPIKVLRSLRWLLLQLGQALCSLVGVFYLAVLIWWILRPLLGPHVIIQLR
jgi:hypothetical protein